MSRSPDADPDQVPDDGTASAAGAAKAPAKVPDDSPDDGGAVRHAADGHVINVRPGQTDEGGDGGMATREQEARLADEEAAEPGRG